MASFTYNKIKSRIMLGTVNMSTEDARVVLVMTNTTTDTEKDAATWANFTTPDEMDGANYTSGGIALTGEAVTEDFGNNRAFFDAGDISWTALGAGTRQVQAMLVIFWKTNLAGSWPFVYIDTGGFPLTASGANLNVTWNAAGIWQFTG